MCSEPSTVFDVLLLSGIALGTILISIEIFSSLFAHFERSGAAAH